MPTIQATIAQADLDRFLAEDDGKPVVMLNLLRFRPDGGRERYFEYLNMMAPIITRFGMEIIYAGDGGSPLVAEPGQSWDAVVLVRYPTRCAFADMIADPDYAAANALRKSALNEIVLQPTRSL